MNAKLFNVNHFRPSTFKNKISDTIFVKAYYKVSIKEYCSSRVLKQLDSLNYYKLAPFSIIPVRLDFFEV